LPSNTPSLKCFKKYDTVSPQPLRCGLRVFGLFPNCINVLCRSYCNSQSGPGRCLRDRNHAFKKRLMVGRAPKLEIRTGQFLRSCDRRSGIGRSAAPLLRVTTGKRMPQCEYPVEFWRSARPKALLKCRLFGPLNNVPAVRANSLFKLENRNPTRLVQKPKWTRLRGKSENVYSGTRTLCLIDREKNRKFVYPSTQFHFCP
jgi:hypothetical protein